MRLICLAAILSAAFAGSAAAQATRSQAPAPPAAPAPSGAPATPTPPPAQLARTETLNFDNWQTTCQEFVNPARRACSANLQLIQTNQQTNTANVLINWMIQLNEGQLNATIQTPTGVLIGPGLELKAGKAQKKFPFNRCDPQRCEVVFAIDDAASRDIAGAETAELVLRSSQNAPVTFNIPLKGYDRAVQALRR
jgi:invasion protein IalB